MPTTKASRAHSPLPLDRVSAWTSGVNVTVGQHVYYRLTDNDQTAVCGYVWCLGETGGSWWVQPCRHTDVRVGGYSGSRKNHTWAMLHLVVIAHTASVVRKTYPSRLYNVDKSNQLVRMKAKDLP